VISRYLICSLAGRLIGVRLTGAIEILPWRAARSVPLSYAHVEGLIDYRGTIYPVFDLARRLGLGRPGPLGFAAGEKAPADEGRSIVLMDEDDAHFGIDVDGVVKMTMLHDGEESQAPPAPEKTLGIDPRYVKAIMSEDDREILILDFARVLHAD
jgi:chemotaxis signal transduction protein